MVCTWCYKVRSGGSLTSLFVSIFCTCYQLAILLDPEDTNYLSPEEFKFMGKTNMKASNYTTMWLNLKLNIYKMLWKHKWRAVNYIWERKSQGERWWHFQLDLVHNKWLPVRFFSTCCELTKMYQVLEFMKVISTRMEKVNHSCKITS